MPVAKLRWASVDDCFGLNPPLSICSMESQFCAAKVAFQGMHNTVQRNITLLTFCT